jgi:hypothetical protein
VASVVAAAIGAVAGYLGVVVVSWLQEWAEPRLTGRVMGLVALASVALQPVSYAAAGALAELGTSSPFTAGAVVLGSAAVLAAAHTEVRAFR